MPNEKMRYLKAVKPRESVYADSWSDEEGDRSLRISRDNERLYIEVDQQLGGRLAIGVPIADLPELVRALQHAIH